MDLATIVPIPAASYAFGMQFVDLFESCAKGIPNRRMALFVGMSLRGVTVSDNL